MMLINLLYCPGHAPPQLTKNFLVPNVNSGEMETPPRAILPEAWEWRWDHHPRFTDMGLQRRLGL